MKKQVNPVFAAAVIVCVLVFVGYFFWKANRDKPIPEGPGGGRIGQTFSPKAGPSGAGGPGASKPGEAKSGAPKSSEPKAGEAPASTQGHQ